MSNTTSPAPSLVRLTLPERHDTCAGCHRDYDDGPHGTARVQPIVSVDGVPCCYEHAREAGATDDALEAFADEQVRAERRAAGLCPHCAAHALELHDEDCPIVAAQLRIDAGDDARAAE